MLHLNRKPGETILINGDQIKIHIIEINQGMVRIGIEADRSISVDREECVFPTHIRNDDE